MISRRTTRLLAYSLVSKLRHKHYEGGGRYRYSLNPAEVYDFFFENEYQAWLCNAARGAADYCRYDTRQFTDFILRIHTGESVASATRSWTWAQRERLGQKLLKDLAEDIAKHQQGDVDGASPLGQLVQSLELDGYVFRNNVLLTPEADVLEVEEETGVLQHLYSELHLSNQETVFHHLSLSEEHYIAHKWDDSISNSRKFLEGVLREVAVGHHQAAFGSEISSEVYSKPVRVRDYLESSELLAPKEKTALSSSYGLLSETGGHPYMAEGEQARLLRHLALTFSQFVLLRLQGFIASNRE